MFNIGGMELAVIVLAIIFIVEPRRLPEVARMAAKALRFFRNFFSELRESFEVSADEGEGARAAVSDDERYE